MIGRQYIRASTALAALEHFSPIVREALMREADFRNEFQLAADAVMHFSEMDAEFRRSVAFDAIRVALSSSEDNVSITDNAGTTWRIEITTNTEPPTVAFVQGERRFVAPYIILLSPDKGTRIKAFLYRANEVNLPQDVRKSWEALLEERAPDDDEIGLIEDDFNETPVRVLNAIRKNIASPSISLEVLVPRSARYYERLVGECQDEAKFEDFVRDVAVPLMRSNIGWDAFRGYQLGLLLTSHSSLSHALCDLTVDERLLVDVFNWAATHGDAIARASCIEIGLRRISVCPLIREALSKLINAWANNTAATSVDHFSLLSATFFAVGGEMALHRVLSSKPPFWRRLAALAQASVITRELIASGQKHQGLIHWLMGVRSQSFILQCYADLRQEPRWFPEFAMPNRLRNELLGRVWAAAHANATAVGEHGWTHVLIEEGEGTLLSQFQPSEAFYPGPLEGGLDGAQEIPGGWLERIQAPLSETTITAASFVPLVNASLVYRVPSQLVELATAAVVRVDYHLDCSDSKVSLSAVLMGLASVAAVARNHALGDALFVVLRKYRRFYPGDLPVNDALHVAMVACASRERLLDWAKCVGECMNDMAFQDITRDEAENLHSHIRHLCDFVPELWATCGQAEAALQAVIS